MYRMMLQAVGPKVGGKPDRDTVVWALFAFLLFLVLVSLAVRFPVYCCTVSKSLLSRSALC